MSPRGYSAQQGQAPVQAPAGFKYEQYQGTLNSHASPNPATSPITTPQLRDNNGDVAMADANDPYSSMRMPMRPHQSQHISSSSRSSTLHSPLEPSAAAQRYSPMEVLSPTSPYTKAGGSQFSAPPTSRQSPSRSADYHSPQSPYYQGGRQSSQQLPPMASFPTAPEQFSQLGVTSPRGENWPNDPTSPRRMANMSAGPVANKGPVPEFRKIRTSQDLRPRVIAQPPFRRANPEGGFISVRNFPTLLIPRMVCELTILPQPLQALTVHLPATYRICNPSFKYESSRNPRRVLTKPSKGCKNDGYDNEDSDYILYVNDILGSEEAGHK